MQITNICKAKAAEIQLFYITEEENWKQMQITNT